jgi:hypothetical protein
MVQVTLNVSVSISAYGIASRTRWSAVDDALTPLHPYEVSPGGTSSFSVLREPVSAKVRTPPRTLTSF